MRAGCGPAGRPTGTSDELYARALPLLERELAMGGGELAPVLTGTHTHHERRAAAAARATAKGAHGGGGAASGGAASGGGAIADARGEGTAAGAAGAAAGAEELPPPMFAEASVESADQACIQPYPCPCP